MEEMKEMNALVHSFPCENQMKIRISNDFSAPEKVPVEIIPFQKKYPRYMDVGILSLSPISTFRDEEKDKVKPTTLFKWIFFINYYT